MYVYTHLIYTIYLYMYYVYINTYTCFYVCTQHMCKWVYTYINNFI